MKSTLTATNTILAKTLMQAFLDLVPLAKEKSLNKNLQTKKSGCVGLSAIDHTPVMNLLLRRNLL